MLQIRLLSIYFFVTAIFLNLYIVFSASAGMEAKLKCTQMELEKAVDKISVLERLCAEQKEAIDTFMVSLSVLVCVDLEGF